MVELTILGTGAWIADAKNKRFGPSVLLKNEGKNILVDAPGGVNYQLAHAGLLANDIDYIFLTHHHPDHTSGLIQLIGEMYITRRSAKSPLTIVSPDPERFLRSILRPYKSTFDSIGKLTNFRINFKKIDNAEKISKITGIGLKKTAITAHKLSHSKTNEDYGYRFECDGKKIAITGDTAYCEGLIALLSGTDVAICECSHVQKLPGHLTAYEAKAMSLFTKKLVPYHIYPGWDVKKEFREFENIYVAKDLEKSRL